MNVVNFYQKFPNTYLQAGVNVMLKYEAIILCHILRGRFCMHGNIILFSQNIKWKDFRYLNPQQSIIIAFISCRDLE